MSSEVGIEKFQPFCGGGQLIADFAYKFMLLVGADEQGGGEGTEAHFAGGFRRFRQTKVEAVPAAPGFMPDDSAEVFNHVITLGNNQGQVHLLSQGLHCFQTALVLRKGVNIWVIPEGADLVPLLSPVVNGVGSTMGAAAMNQN